MRAHQDIAGFNPAWRGRFAAALDKVWKRLDNTPDAVPIKSGAQLRKPAGRGSQVVTDLIPTAQFSVRNTECSKPGFERQLRAEKRALDRSPIVIGGRRGSGGCLELDVRTPDQIATARIERTSVPKLLPAGHEAFGIVTCSNVSLDTVGDRVTRRLLPLRVSHQPQVHEEK